MERLFSQYPDALANTERIAEMCNLEFTFGQYHLPEFQVPAGETARTYIRALCDQGFAERYRGERPAAVGAQQVHVHPGLDIEALCEGHADHIAEVAVPLLIVHDPSMGSLHDMYGCGKSSCLAGKILAHPAFSGYEYRF